MIELITMYSVVPRAIYAKIDYTVREVGIGNRNVVCHLFRALDCMDLLILQRETRRPIILSSEGLARKDRCYYLK